MTEMDQGKSYPGWDAFVRVDNDILTIATWPGTPGRRGGTDEPGGGRDRRRWLNRSLVSFGAAYGVTLSAKAALPVKGSVTLHQPRRWA